VDDLKIGTAFSEVFDVVATPPTLTVTKSGSGVEISWPTANSTGYVLQSRDAFGVGNWGTASETVTVSGDKNVVTITGGGSGTRFYRLNKP
jgi:hypothetical protein